MQLAQIIRENTLSMFSKPKQYKVEINNKMSKMKNKVFTQSSAAADEWHASPWEGKRDRSTSSVSSNAINFQSTCLHVRPGPERPLHPDQGLRSS